MQALSVKEANWGFGRLIDLAPAEPVAAAAAVAKHGRPAVVVLVIEDNKRLKPLDVPSRTVFFAALAEIGGDETTYDLVKQALIDGGLINSSVLRSE
jgi:hypothetical protein